MPMPNSIANTINTGKRLPGNRCPELKNNNNFGSVDFRFLISEFILH